MNDDDWLAEVEAAIGAGPRLIRGAQEFNRAFDHVYRLLRDAACLFRDSSVASAMFFAITALEETAKVYVGMYRHSEDPTNRRDDPLYRHKAKHALAAAPTIPVGSRLMEAVGTEKVAALIQAARSGQLVRVREGCLYLESNQNRLRIPAEEITKEEARAVLLFSIESFDDALVGYTNHSLELGKEADDLFASVRDA
jgi:AbiV family abortive infection protein